ncbi:50S ribosomal protein L3 [Patescibacteria group bacterium]|nr:50S ribosomal protein L3 [Patescibacteria group bacterium]
MRFILGKKIEMSQIFDENGKIIPVTLVEAGPCFVTEIKDLAVQIGFEKLRDKKVKMPQKDRPYRYLKEQATKNAEAFKLGSKISVSVFKEGDKVVVSGITKGKGFQGGVKKHGFHGRNASHGTKHEERTIGSIGSRFPQRVIKGRKMPGRMGADRVSVKGLKIIKIDLKNNILAVKGAIPGHRGTLLEIRTLK